MSNNTMGQAVSCNKSMASSVKNVGRVSNSSDRGSEGLGLGDAPVLSLEGLGHRLVGHLAGTVSNHSMGNTVSNDTVGKTMPNRRGSKYLRRSCCCCNSCSKNNTSLQKQSLSLLPIKCSTAKRTFMVHV